MLAFQVPENDGSTEGWIRHAYLVGPDDVAAKGTVVFEDGLLVCKKRVGFNVGVALPFDAGEPGEMMLQTCLLPEREEPYLLSLELARHRIKLFIQKSEEWQMFDLSSEHRAVQLWERARVLFTRALTEEDRVKADELARRSLAAGIQASERLAMAHADLLLHRRFAHRAASSATLGIRMWPGRDGKGLRELVQREFDVLVMPVTWREVEVEEGKYDWSAIDRWMEWAHQQGKPIVAGPLLDFSRRALPKWMYVWQHDYDTCRDLAYDHAERFVQRYAGAVAFWNVASGLNTNQNFSFKPQQMIDLVRMAALLVRQTRRGARVMVEVRQPFGERCGINRNAMPPLTFVERLVQEGVRLDAVGVQLLFGQGTDGAITRDLMQISNLLDRFFYLELPVIISAMGVPSAEVEPPGGRWRSGWSPETQQRWISAMFRVAMSKPFVESIFWSEMVDYDDAELRHAGLINSEGQPKPALQRLISMRKKLRKPLGELNMPSKAPADDA